MKGILIFVSIVCLSLITSKTALPQSPAISKNFLLGRYSYIKDTSFIRVPASYSLNQVYLKKEAYSAFCRMHAAALKDGITLKIISGTRSFDDQKYKWELKWNSPEFSHIQRSSDKARTLLRWWSMPGTSRHHWGTEVDLNNMKLAYYKTAEGKKLYEWLFKNASKFGFYQPFNSGRPGGYQEEKWHWSYVPLSRLYMKEYLKNITEADILGFKGSEAAKGLYVIRNWVLEVNPECR